ncbi:MAG TPA: hypothetical protein VGV89_10910 [Thermoplasmata archaeon]|nr:hypothetical protein [Thermoplasmata archaeon]
MEAEPNDTDPPPPARRESWSLRSIVLDVSGHTLEDYQDPDRTPHPYLRVKPAHAGEAHPTSREPPRALEPPPEDPTTNPVARIFPPLTGPLGRAFHAPEHHHHSETLGRAGPPVPGGRDPPSRRPERIYLHYLLLHVDRLSDHALRYLKHAVDEELQHREAPPPPASVPAPEPSP